MALFGSKKNTEAKPAKKTADKKAEKAESKAVAVVESAQENIRDISGIIKRPRITEKASMKAEANVYAFEIAPNPNKNPKEAEIYPKQNGSYRWW
jgi:vacuolar-type H+-ATPase subunit E/Vma4